MSISLLQINQNDDQQSVLKAVEVKKDNPHLHLVKPEGQLQINTAPFRGSFSVVLSEALRAAGLGSQVLVAQFLKGGINQGPNGSITLCGKMNWLRPAINCCISNPIMKDSTDPENNLINKAVLEVWQICKKHLSQGKLNQIVLDEVGLAVSLGYLEEKDVVSALEQRPKAMDIILTGPSIPSRVMNMADQVTQLRCSL